MAFFMLMWLLNATKEKQRKGLADYFHPTIAVSCISGGGDGMLSGDSLFSEEALAHQGTPVKILQLAEKQVKKSNQEMTKNKLGRTQKTKYLELWREC